MPDIRVVFRCSICQAAITQPVSPLKQDQAVSLEEGKAVVPKGFFAPNKKEYWTTTGSVIVNLADLVSTRRHPDFRRVNGCCGFDGCDGPNLVCRNGHEIGTKKSDCWTPHAAILVEGVVPVNA